MPKIDKTRTPAGPYENIRDSKVFSEEHQVEKTPLTRVQVEKAVPNQVESRNEKLNSTISIPKAIESKDKIPLMFGVSDKGSDNRLF